jgi:hypothetical protein
MLVAVTLQKTSTEPNTSKQQVILSSSQFSLVKIGSGAMWTMFLKIKYEN